MKLNLGCGEKHKKEFINMDIQEPCDMIWDMRTTMPFEDNSVDEIFAENSVYKISREEWVGLRKEMARVLKPGGEIGIVVHDLEYVYKAFLDNKDGKRWTWWWATIYGMQEDQYDFKKNGFTYERLVADFWEVGMTNFRREEYTEEEYGESYIYFVCNKL